MAVPALKMVERTIGAKIGTGGSAGADYLRRTLFAPAFPTCGGPSQTQEPAREEALTDGG